MSKFLKYSDASTAQDVRRPTIGVFLRVALRFTIRSLLLALLELSVNKYETFRELSMWPIISFATPKVGVHRDKNREEEIGDKSSVSETAIRLKTR